MYKRNEPFRLPIEAKLNKEPLFYQGILSEKKVRLFHLCIRHSSKESRSSRRKQGKNSNKLVKRTSYFS